MDFENLMEDRYHIKCHIENSKPRFNKNGERIEFLLTKEEYISVFLPYREDERLYLKSIDRDRLVLCRKNDDGHYTVDNVYVDTMLNNSKEAYHNRDDIFTKEFLSECGKKAAKVIKEKYPEGTFRGRVHSEETKSSVKKIYEEIEHQKGSKNSQYGTCWIFNVQLEQNKKIPLEELSYWEAKGWSKGRKMKFTASMA